MTHLLSAASHYTRMLVHGQRDGQSAYWAGIPLRPLESMRVQELVLQLHLALVALLVFGGDLFPLGSIDLRQSLELHGGELDLMGGACQSVFIV